MLKCNMNFQKSLELSNKKKLQQEAKTSSIDQLFRNK